MWIVNGINPQTEALLQVTEPRTPTVQTSTASSCWDKTVWHNLKLLLKNKKIKTVINHYGNKEKWRRKKKHIYRNLFLSLPALVLWSYYWVHLQILNLDEFFLSLLLLNHKIVHAKSWSSLFPRTLGTGNDPWRWFYTDWKSWEIATRC